MALDIWNDLLEKLPAYKAEYERLGRLIAMIEGVGEVSESGEAAGDSRPATQTASNGGKQQRTPNATVGRDDFVGMSISEAVKAYLGKMGRGHPKGPRDIAQAMIQGGRGDTDEGTCYDSVSSALKRMKKTGDVTQVRRGEWGLSSWYNTSAKKGEGE